MKNLSLQFTQNASLKKMAEAAHKPDKNDAAEPNVSFQMLLTQQVKAQHKSAKQVQNQQEFIEKTPTTQEISAVPPVDQKVDAKVNLAEFVAAVEKKPSNKKEIDNTSKMIDLADKPSEMPLLALDTKAPSKNEDETKSDTDDTTTDTNVAVTVSVAIPLFAPIAHAVALESMPKNQLVSAEKTSNTKLEVKLSNMLSPSTGAPKAAFAPVSTEPKTQSNDAPLAVETRPVSSQTRWLDVMQPNMSKQAGASDAMTEKLLLNALKDGVNKDVDTKNMVPANSQPAVHVNSPLRAEQAGSANNINAYLGKTGWDQAISQKVVWMMGAGEQSATLTLNPPDLGPLQVVINVQNDKADTTFISDNSEVRQALQDGMANLREKMSESGIQLGQANVSTGGQYEQAFQQKSQQTEQNRAALQANRDAGLAQADKTTVANTIMRVANGLVDTFA